MAAVRDVVRKVVAEAAPEELPLVDGMAVYDDDTVVRRLRRSGPRREPLGFGWGEVVALVTPVVWLLLDEVAQRFAGATVDGATTGVKRLLRRFRRGRRRHTALPVLTAEQRDEVRQEVLALLTRKEIDPATAVKVADAVARSLVSHTGDDPTPGADAARAVR
ncbi:hypothetical protein FHR81_004685 [Actinoalloteichus hoggarensis]|nr:hypothetical protein [Actinoalloteichus hoggarensis]MBB5923614.1 hypothetical protein [Actinoalloteichus hoggarensis]